MRPRFPYWSHASIVCSVSGHVAPAAEVEVLRLEDNSLGVEEADGTRLVRCLRCDLWLRVDAPEPGTARWHELPPPDELDLPLRDLALRQRLVLRLIALERSLHVLVFASLAIAALALQLELPSIQNWATELLGDLQDVVSNTSRAGSYKWMTKQLARLTDLGRPELWIIFVVSAAYATLEAVEAVGLWLGKRWAEYLTVVATAGLLPLAVTELIDNPTLFKVIATALDLAIIFWLVWVKRLFGVRGGYEASEPKTDWASILANPDTPNAMRRLAPDSGPFPDHATATASGTGAATAIDDAEQRPSTH